MKIALDYDKTYTADTVLWNSFIKTAKSRQHEVYIVTMRSNADPVKFPKSIVGLFTDIIYTHDLAKQPFCERMGLTFEIWIDDQPAKILKDYNEINT